MARLEKQFDKNKWAEMLKIKQAEDKAVKEALRANKAAGLMISEGGKGGSPNTPTPDWDKDWPKPGTKPRPEDRPNIPTKLANFIGPSGHGTTLSEDEYWRGYDTIMETTVDGSDEQIKRLNILWHQFNDQVSNPQSELMISHHTGGKHFTEPSMEELIDGLINGDVPRGTLGDEETENRLIEERQNQLQQQSLMIKNNVANLPYQDGRAPTRLFYNAPYAKPDVFIKDKQIIEDAKKRFKWNTGINLARR